MNDITFVLNEKEITIPYTKTILDKIPSKKEHIWKELSQKARHIVETQVDEEIFDSYLEYWKSGSLPEITSQNIWSFYQLSEEFGLLSEYLSQPKFENLFNLSYLINYKQNLPIDKSDIEKKISQNLKFYLENFRNDMKNIQITSLSNIFNNSERKLEDHDLAYQFIIENPNFYFLLRCLDYNKIKNQEYKKDACLNRDNHDGFCPQNTDNFIIQLEHELKEANEKNQKLENTIKYFIEKAQYLIKKNQEVDQVIMPKYEQLTKNMDLVDKLKIQYILQNVALKVDKLVEEKHISGSEAINSITQAINSIEDKSSDEPPEQEEIVN